MVAIVPTIQLTAHTWKDSVRGCKGLTLATKLVADFIADRAGEDGASWWSVGRIANALTITRQTVQRATKSLSDKGFLEVAARWTTQGCEYSGKKRQTSNTYRLVGVTPDNHRAAAVDRGGGNIGHPRGATGEIP